MIDAEPRAKEEGTVWQAWNGQVRKTSDRWDSRIGERDSAGVNVTSEVLRARARMAA